MHNNLNRERGRNADCSGRDPLNPGPGSYPLGAGVSSCAVADAATGSAIGPLATVAGGVTGAVVGRLGGKPITQAVDPAAEDTYWQQRYYARPYATPDMTYEDFRPAYRYGWENAERADGESFRESAWWLERDWDRFKGSSPLNWARAKHAVRDAWERVNSPFQYGRRYEPWLPPLPHDEPGFMPGSPD